MGRNSLGVLTLGVLLLAAASEGAELPPGCEGVRKVLQLRRLGPLGDVPESPRAGKEGSACGAGGTGSGGAAGFELGAAGGDGRVVLVAGLGRRASGVPRWLRTYIGLGEWATGPLLKRESALLGLWALEQPDTCLKPLVPTHFHSVSDRAERARFSWGHPVAAAGRHRDSGASADPAGWGQHRTAAGACWSYSAVK